VSTAVPVLPTVKVWPLEAPTFVAGKLTGLPSSLGRLLSVIVISGPATAVSTTSFPVPPA
jgi:hypothetical protein